MNRIIISLFLAICSMAAMAQAYPTVSISFDVTDGTGTQHETDKQLFEGSAPITCNFKFKVENGDGWQHDYEWRFVYEKGSFEEPYMIRYEAEPEIVFTQGTAVRVVLYSTFTKGDRVVRYDNEYWTTEGTPLFIKPTASTLTMPNAFSPNGDGKNDTYKPITYNSIVEFRCIIFNRWGQKIYEWRDVSADGWDGTHNGTPVKEGVYYALVRAKGADGTEHNFKRDVNLLRSYDRAAKEDGR